MRVFRLGPLLLLLGVAPNALAQAAAPSRAAPAAQPGPPEPPPPDPTPPDPPAPAPEPPAPAVAPPAPTEVVSAPEPSAAPAAAPPASVTAAPTEEPAHTPAQAALPPFERAHAPLTLEGRLGFSLRPESDSGFDDETILGTELGLSLYYDLTRALGAGIELDHVGLGRGTALTGLSSVSVDYTVTSAMLGFRAYPYRRELLDVFVGLQLGLGIQGISATGTRSESALASSSPYACDASDSPALQLGGGVGARLMLTPRVGISARINVAGRRLSSDLLDDCARGLGAVTTVGASLGVGYDFDLDP